MVWERVMVASDNGGVREVVGGVVSLAWPRDTNPLAEALELVFAISREKYDGFGGLAREHVIERYLLPVIAFFFGLALSYSGIPLKECSAKPVRQ
jgi:glycosyltransferase involved in cell wall biosynthesis